MRCSLPLQMSSAHALLHLGHRWRRWCRTLWALGRSTSLVTVSAPLVALTIGSTSLSTRASSVTTHRVTDRAELDVWAREHWLTEHPWAERVRVVHVID